MRSNYKKLGQLIRDVSVKNKALNVELLLGVSITKRFIPSIANTVGTDMSTYKIVKRNQFAYGTVTSRNGEKISIALLTEDECLVSSSYTVFEIVDTELFEPEYLMMWFRRSEFDRYARFMSHGTVREQFGWEDMCDVELPVPSIEKQREIIREYNVVNDRIALNEQLTQKLEDTAQSIYKQWFVDFEFPISKEYAESIGKPELIGAPYKSSGGKIAYCADIKCDIPENWTAKTVGELCSVLDSKRKPLSGEHRQTMQGPYPYYGAMSIVDHVNDYLFDGTYILFSEDGANVVDDQGYPALQYVWGKFWVNNHAHILQGLNDVTNEYLYLALKKTQFGHLVTGAAQPKINQKNMVGVYLCAPDSSTLKAFDPLSSVIFTKIKNISEMTKTLKKLKNILLCKVC